MLIKVLPNSERFAQLKIERKHFVETIKLMAYRADTAFVQLVREKLGRLYDARSLIRQVLSNAAGL